ncbi:hypothetical protein IID24_02405 [Patescibacteria group bacterium]|nr:hypothetical protein [Patescibacteria group bacterium]
MEAKRKLLPNSEVELEIEVSPQELDGYYLKALSEMAKTLHTEGFRRGHVPNYIAERELGEQKILTEAAHMAIKEQYAAALQEQLMDAAGDPDIRIQKLAKGNPFVFKAKVAVLPIVELPNYQTIVPHVKKKEISVAEQEIEETLTWLQQNKKKEDATIPELSDEFARSLGNFDTLSGLKENIKSGLRQEKELQEKQRIRQELLEKISEKTQCEIPEILIESEKKAILNNVKEGVKTTLHIEFSEYLEKLKKSEEELRDSFNEEARKRVKGYLVLREIAKRENITATQEEIQREADRILRQYRDTKSAAEELDSERVKGYTEGVIVNEKTFQFLESFIK